MSSAGGKRRRSDPEVHADEIAAAVAAAAAATAAATAAADAKHAAAAAAADAKMTASAAKKERDFVCAICHDLLEEPVSTPCGHNFCKACLREWLANKATCPLCTAVVAASLPLAVNKVLEAAIEANAGPLFLARSTGASQHFYDKLVALDPAGALAAFGAAVDVTRFVGDAAARLTPLLWACKNAKGDKADVWIALTKALIARPTVDVNARPVDGRSSLSHVASAGWFYSIVELVPLLMSKGVRDGHALGLFVHFRWTPFDVTAAHYVPLCTVLSLLAKDDSILQVAAPDRSLLLSRTLKNGFDSAAVELLNKGFRTEPAKDMLKYAASGGCAAACALLIKMPAPMVPVDTLSDRMQTALQIACSNGHAKAALALLAGGATMHSEPDDFWCTPLTLCVTSAIATFPAHF